jgi:hypothetical protein
LWVELGGQAQLSGGHRGAGVDLCRRVDPDLVVLDLMLLGPTSAESGSARAGYCPTA